MRCHRTSLPGTRVDLSRSRVVGTSTRGAPCVCSYGSDPVWPLQWPVCQWRSGGRGPARPSTVLSRSPRPCEPRPANAGRRPGDRMPRVGAIGTLTDRDGSLPATDANGSCGRDARHPSRPGIVCRAHRRKGTIRSPTEVGTKVPGCVASNRNIRGRTPTWMHGKSSTYEVTGRHRQRRICDGRWPARR